MKKHRKQLVKVLGQKLLVDVPVDDELYKMDNHSEYQRTRSIDKDMPLHEIVLADLDANIAEAYEEAQLHKCLREALNMLNEKERRLVEYLYYDGLTDQKAATLMNVSRPAVTKKKKIIIEKLRKSLIDWL